MENIGLQSLVDKAEIVAINHDNKLYVVAGYTVIAIYDLKDATEHQQALELQRLLSPVNVGLEASIRG